MQGGPVDQKPQGGPRRRGSRSRASPCGLHFSSFCFEGHVQLRPGLLCSVIFQSSWLNHCGFRAAFSGSSV